MVSPIAAIDVATGTHQNPPGQRRRSHHKDINTAKAPINKSQAIREALAANPDKSPIELAAVLKEHGVKVTPLYISAIKSKLKGKKRGWKRGAKRRLRLAKTAVTA